MIQSDETDFLGGWPKTRGAALSLMIGRLLSLPSKKMRAFGTSFNRRLALLRDRKTMAVLLAALIGAQLFAATIVLAQNVCNAEGESTDCDFDLEINDDDEGGRGGSGGDPEANAGDINAGDARGGDGGTGGGNGGPGGGGGAAGGSGKFAGATLGGSGGGGNGGPGGPGSCVSIGGSARSGDARSDTSVENTGGSTTAPVTVGATADPSPQNAGNARSEGDDFSRNDQGDNSSYNARRSESIPIGGNSNGCGGGGGDATGGSNRDATSTATIDRSGNAARGGDTGNREDNSNNVDCRQSQDDCGVVDFREADFRTQSQEPESVSGASTSSTQQDGATNQQSQSTQPSPEQTNSTSEYEDERSDRLAESRP